MTLKQADPEIRTLDLNQLRLDLKDAEDSEEGMPWPDTHRHNTTVTLGGITLARTFEIINGYTVTFEDGQYAVEASGCNSNIADVMNVNQVSLRTFNSAGLVQVVSGSGLSPEEHDELMAIQDGVRGVDNDTLKTVSDQMDVVEAGVAALDTDLTSVLQIDQLLLAFVQNKKYLTKIGATWHLVIRDALDAGDILRKELKDKDGNEIADIAAGVLARELKSVV